jgi:hypothetical protein
VSFKWKAAVVSRSTTALDHEWMEDIDILMANPSPICDWSVEAGYSALFPMHKFGVESARWRCR